MVSDSSTSTAPTGFPTGMPRMIQPPGGVPSPEEVNGTLVQVAFNYGLNYRFVAQNPTAISQIFAFLPQGLAYGMGIDPAHVKMNALVPYDTSKQLGYMKTLAQAYVPSDMVDQLQLNLHTPVSSIYGNPSAAVRTLMSMVDPSLPVQPGSTTDGSQTAIDNPAATTSSSAGDGAPIGADSGASQPVRGTSVGIGVGAACGAAVYAAAMIYVARRYRKRRQSHQRSSSVPAVAGRPEMAQYGAVGGGMGGYFMSGGDGRTASGSAMSSAARGSRNSAGSSNGRSVREQGISAPVMSENSLGWN
ncbi:hypothetical protein B0A48_12093 [Cryoendolithus antarcticus]|uniref:Uncharacterized protein n=1 Tax=Cryoendolithus antarcticus TaxID=1507870 RepID=A0A1V8STP4_9PEZI|nr:hypothetical protein B0A48_12093 [Cryoendolithus antarcticus]